MDAITRSNQRKVRETLEIISNWKQEGRVLIVPISGCPAHIFEQRITNLKTFRDRLLKVFEVDLVRIEVEWSEGLSEPHEKVSEDEQQSKGFNPEDYWDCGDLPGYIDNIEWAYDT